MTFAPEPCVAAIGFASPWFLGAGAAAIAIPILIHILNRRRHRTISWAAMDFLLRALKKNRRRLRFEQMALLITRCLVLVLLGMALARPMGCDQNSLAGLVGQRSGLHVIVINNSGTMAYQANRPGARTQLDQAKLVAKQIISQLSAGGESVAIITAAKPASAVIAMPTYDLRAAAEAVDRIQQSCGESDEIGALSLAREIGRSAATPGKSLYLIDDSTRVTWSRDRDAIQQDALELGLIFKTRAVHFNLGLRGEWNHAIVALKPAESLVTDWFPADFVSDVRGYGPGPEDARVLWKVDDQVLGDGAMAAKATPTASPLTMTDSSLPGGFHVVTAALQSSDALPADDVRYRVVNVVSQLKVLIVEGERGVGGLGSSGAFLDTALDPPITGSDLIGRKTTSYVATERISDLELPAKVLGNYRCICLCGVGQISDAEAAQLETYVRAGGTLMLFMGNDVTSENYNATLLKHHLLPGALVKRVTVNADQPPIRFDFNPRRPLHPLLADFQNQSNTGMESAEIYSYWQVAIPPNSPVERVLNFQRQDSARDRGEDPAITVQSLGSGRVVFYATSADPNSEWTTFMAHQAYPALMHMLLLGTVRSGDEWMNLIVGQPLLVPPWVKLSQSPVLKDRQTIQYPLQATADEQGQTVYRSAPLNKPGVYSLTTGLENYQIAVNVPADEADVRPMNPDQLHAELSGLSAEFVGDALPQPTAAADSGRDYGWSIMAVVAGLLGLESLMAMAFGHRRY